MIVGYRCAACAHLVDIATAWPWRCPNSTLIDRHHVLRLMGVHRRPSIDDHPLLVGDANLAWLSFANAHGMTTSAIDTLVAEVDDAVFAVGGTRFHITPYGRQDKLSDALGFDHTGGVFVKDETRAVGGSHKARHLVGILLHLRVAELRGVAPIEQRPPLAIASCGNAALAAATLAAAAQWPLLVFVPTWANPAVLSRLESLGATIELCPRRDDDPPGDPCVYRFRAAVDGGAVPFSVQGPENGLCLDAGRSLAWEMAAQSEGQPLDALVIQVGGGAFATCAADGFRGGPSPRLTVVQPAACAPFDHAWRKAQRLGTDDIGMEWNQCMRPWIPFDGAPITSVASGLLDDETYDWVGVVEGLARSRGTSLVATEAELEQANQLARQHTSVAVDPTGSAGLAALVSPHGPYSPTDRVGVVFSGVDRQSE